MKRITLYTFLGKRGACRESMEYARGKTLKQAYDGPFRPFWLSWFFCNILFDYKLMTIEDTLHERYRALAIKNQTEEKWRKMLRKAIPYSTLRRCPMLKGVR